jgi:hypothetical protein
MPAAEYMVAAVRRNNFQASYGAAKINVRSHTKDTFWHR